MEIKYYLRVVSVRPTFTLLGVDTFNLKVLLKYIHIPHEEKLKEINPSMIGAKILSTVLGIVILCEFKPGTLSTDR